MTHHHHHRGRRRPPLTLDLDTGVDGRPRTPGATRFRRDAGFGGPPEGFGPPSGFGPPWARGPHGPRGPRGRRGRSRGDVRAALLLLLDEQPRHGYELIQEISDRSGGTWSPSPGSVYPTLQALADEGLLTIDAVEGRRTASLTDEGRAYVAENRERLGTPWTAGTDVEQAVALRREIHALMDAVGQVARIGTPAQQEAAGTVLARARKELYRLLAEDVDPT